MPKIDKSKMNKFQSLGASIREIRERKGLLLRQVAAGLEVDTAFISKIERGEKRINKEQVKKISKFLGTSENKLMDLWLAEKIMIAIEGEERADQALKLVLKKIKKS